MELLNNREWALVIWISFVCLFVICSPKMDQARKSLGNLVKLFFTRPIASVLLLLLIYITIMIYGLAKVGLWEFHQLKNTIVWTVSVAFLSLFRLESAKQDPHFIKNLVLDNLKLIAIVQFVIGIYVFSLVTELVLVPMMAIVGAMLALTQRDKKFHTVEKILNGILVTLGITFIVHAIYMLATNFGEFGKVQTIYDFSSPPLLTFLYLPFIFFMMVFTTYELVYTRLQFLVKDPSVRRYAKIYSFINFNFNIKLLERWASSLPFQDTSSKPGIKKSVKLLFKLLTVEKNPPKVLPNEGWSPYEAKNFLLNEGIKTGHYHFITPNEWVASSSLVEIDNGLLPNNISYYVEGSETTANILKLILNVNQSENSEMAHMKLLSSIKVLLNISLGLELTKKQEKAIVDGDDIKSVYGNFEFSVEKNEWPQNSIGGYDIRFILNHI